LRCALRRLPSVWSSLRRIKSDAFDIPGSVS
jgi:hypothetical protein